MAAERHPSSTSRSTSVAGMRVNYSSLTAHQKAEAIEVVGELEAQIPRGVHERTCERASRNLTCRRGCYRRESLFCHPRRLRLLSDLRMNSGRLAGLVGWVVFIPGHKTIETPQAMACAKLRLGCLRHCFQDIVPRVQNREPLTCRTRHRIVRTIVRNNGGGCGDVEIRTAC